ncbi:hypothetical protein ACP8Y2_24120 [Herpetosiphon llansteffanensis]
MKPMVGRRLFSFLGIITLLWAITPSRAISRLEPIESRAGTPIAGLWNPHLATHLRDRSTIGHAIVGADQNLYIAGGFSYINDLPAHGLARWDGTQWHSLATSIADLNQAQSLAFFDNKLIVGGGFNTWADQPLAHLVQWNGSAWSQVGSGIQGFFTNGSTLTTTVRDLTTLTNTLVIGGNFTKFNQQAAAGLAGWDSTTNVQIGAANSQVNVTVANTDTLMIQGMFSSIDNQDVGNNLAIRRAGQWSFVAPPPSYQVYQLALASVDQTIYAMAHNQDSNQTDLFRWQQQTWVKLGPTLAGQFNRMTIVNGAIYLAQSNGDANRNDNFGVIAQLLNNQWQAVNLPHSYAKISQLLTIGSDLYIIGEQLSNPQSAGLPPTFTVKRWNGTTLSLIGEVWQAPEIHTLEGDANHVWATGRPDYMNQQSYSTVMFWNGAQWQGLGRPQLPNTSTEIPHLIKTSENIVYFTTSLPITLDQRTATNLWRLDRVANAWNPIPINGIFSGWNTTGKDVLGNAVVATINNRDVTGIQRLRDNTWLWETNTTNLCNLCLPFELNGEYYHTSVADRIYLSHWNGLGWDVLTGWEFNHPQNLGFYPVVVWRDDFYFISGRKLQRYNLTTQAVEEIALLDGNGYSLATFTDQYLYIGGDFSSINGIAANNLARWDGTTWQAFSQEPNGPVLEISTSPNYVYIAGTFSQVGTINSLGIGVYHLSSPYQVFAPIINK